MTVRHIIFSMALLFATEAFAQWGLPGQTCSGAGGVGCDQPIPEFGTIRSAFDVTDCPQVLDVAVGLDISHSWIGDLVITLESPGKTAVKIVSEPDCSEQDMHAVLDDDAPTPVDDECPFGPIPAIHGVFQPTEPLAGFNGESGNGSWVLAVSDVYEGDSGNLNEWTLDLVCHEPEVIECDGFESCPTL